MMSTNEFSIGRISLNKAKLTDWLLRRANQGEADPEQTEPQASPEPLEQDDECEPTVLTGHAIIDVGTQPLTAWVSEHPDGEVSRLLDAYDEYERTEVNDEVAP